MLVLAVAALLVGDASGQLVAQPVGWIVLYAVLCVAVVGARGGYRFRLEPSPFEYLGQVLAETSVGSAPGVSSASLSRNMRIRPRARRRP